MGAGKTTKSKQVVVERNAVLVSEDDWLATLYPHQIKSFEDYKEFSARLKPLVKRHVQNILRTGPNVVMDFPANTVSQRNWFKVMASEIGALHELIYLNTSEEICLKRITQRSVDMPERASFDTEEVFRQVTRYFEEPSAKEGLNIRKIDLSE